MNLVWLHCEGPDGPCVLLASHCRRTGTYDLFEDGREAENPRENEKGEVWVHKWVVLHQEPVRKPNFRREP